MIDEYVKGVQISEYMEGVLDGDMFFGNLSNYTGTNLKSANQFLHSYLNEDEKKCLFELVNSRTGWYLRINGIGAKKLKLTGANLGITHMMIAMPEDNGNVQELVNSISEDEQIILRSVYLKQKFVTLKNLKNNNKDKLILFRGVKNITKDKDEYGALSLESWSSNADVARRFSGVDGIVLKKEFNIEDIFAYNKSIFKQEGLSDKSLSIKINTEYEYIVEFTENNSIIDLKDGNNIVNL